MSAHRNAQGATEANSQAKGGYLSKCCDGMKDTPTPPHPQHIVPRIPDAGSDTAILVRSDGMPIIVDKADYARLNQYRWFPAGTKSGYAARSVSRNGKGRILYMHRELASPPPGYVIDHIDGNPLNNTRANLRVCTKAQNSANRTVCLNHTGFLGIGYDPVQDRYQGAVMRDGARFRGPWRLTAREAAQDYDCLARGVHGEYARLNFPQSGEQGVSRPGGPSC
ncbi:MAG: hypothetical protein CMM78_05220 [Rhodospirillaceae bacterium]|nr:hypothetical protein [Rhodospirillales bacterium]MAX47588.1 hypothetical protein [Rhodospirillaceae bacterium]|tara:strand:+ start:5998 stop:6666 length:669 start_codon:yes stop_codon:yes gene_type:complete